MDNEQDKVSEPLVAYGLTPDERIIMTELSLLRGNKEALHRILLFIRHDIRHQDDASTNSGQRKFMKLKGILSDYPESDKDHIAQILKEKHKS